MKRQKKVQQTIFSEPSYKVRDYRGSDARKPQMGPLYPSPQHRPNSYRPRVYTNLVDTSVSVDISTRTSMVRYSRELFASVGNLGGAVLQKNQWAFTDGWLPVYKGENQEWGDEAEAFLRNSWYPICNVRGGNYDFRTSLFLLGVALDVDGDQLIIFTKSRDGFPLLQFVPSHRIGQRDYSEKTVKKGRYRGAKIVDGVIVNTSGRAVAYRILGDAHDGSEDYEISAQSALLLYEPEWADTVRGIPRVARTVLDWMDVQDVDSYLKTAVKLDSSQGLIHATKDGGPDAGANLVTSEEDATVTANASLTLENFGPNNEIYYVSAGSGETVEPFRTERPHTNVTAFLERIERRGLYAIGWPIELADPSKVGGASVRLIQDLARKSIKSRQATGDRFAKWAVPWVLSVAMENDLLPKNYNDDWWSWNFTKPALITVDNGNEAAADRESLRIGTASMSEVTAKRGGDWYELRQQIEIETADLLERAKRLSEEHNITYDKALELLTQRGSSPTAKASPVDN